jgi:hypothetical protein
LHPDVRLINVTEQVETVAQRLCWVQGAIHGMLNESAKAYCFRHETEARRLLGLGVSG